MCDDQLIFLSTLYNRWYQGEHLHAIYKGDFYALPNTKPHGPIANAKPLLNFTTIWKVFSECLQTFLTPILCATQVIPPLQFALYVGALAIDTVRVVHDFILDRLFADLLVCLVLDDVRHVFGSVQHEKLKSILHLLCFPPHLIDILMHAATGVTVHMGGFGGIAQAMAKFRARIAQGCPMSALLFCILLEFHIQMVLHDIPLPQSSCGNFAYIAYMDDTTYLLNTVSDVQHLLNNLYQTDIKTHLHTSTIKLLVVVVHRQRMQTIFHRPHILARGSRAPAVDGQGGGFLRNPLAWGVLNPPLFLNRSEGGF